MEAAQRAQGSADGGTDAEAQLRHLAAVCERPVPEVAIGADTEARLLQLAAAARPLRRALAALAARLVETRAYEPLCYARLGDYARERAGLSARQLRDLAHVHGALVAMPRLERALVAGELPWSKVRLVARVASAADVGAWIALARALPIRRFEREVSSLGEPADGANGTGGAGGVGRGGSGGWQDPDAGAPLTQVTVHCTPAVREKWALARELAERVAGERLRAGDALEWVTAEACSGAAIGPWWTGAFEAPPVRPRSENDDDPADDTEIAREACMRALPSPQCPAVAELLDGLEHAGAFEIDRRLREAVRLEQSLDAAVAPLLRMVTSSEYEWSGACHTLSAFAAEQLGMSPSKARALLRIERAGDVCPELRHAFRDGRLSWAKALCLVPFLLLDFSGEWRPRWVAWAERVTVRRLEADVERSLLLRAASEAAWQRCKFNPDLAQDPLSETERQKCAAEIDVDATERLSWRVPFDVAGLFIAARESLRAALCAAGLPAPSDGEAFEALLDAAIATWSLRDPAARRPDPVIERDGYRCSVPGCSSRCSLHDHQPALPAPAAHAHLGRRAARPRLRARRSHRRRAPRPLRLRRRHALISHYDYGEQAAAARAWRCRRVAARPARPLASSTNVPGSGTYGVIGTRTPRVNGGSVPKGARAT